MAEPEPIAGPADGLEGFLRLYVVYIKGLTCLSSLNTWKLPETTYSEGIGSESFKGLQ